MVGAKLSLQLNHGAIWLRWTPRAARETTLRSLPLPRWRLRVGTWVRPLRSCGFPQARSELQPIAVYTFTQIGVSPERLDRRGGCHRTRLGSAGVPGIVDLTRDALVRPRQYAIATETRPRRSFGACANAGVPNPGPSAFPTPSTRSQGAARHAGDRIRRPYRQA